MSDSLTTARPVNTGSYRFVRLGDAHSNGLKIRWPQGREGSNPSLGTNYINNLAAVSRVNELHYGVSLRCATHFG